jgi:hypothetical protein
LAERGELPAYKVAGVYLRFRHQDVENLKKKGIKSGLLSEPPQVSFKEKIIDFFYFNDFYIFSFIVIIWLIVIILKTK